MQRLPLQKNLWRSYRQIIFQVIIWLIILLFPLLSYNIRVLDQTFYVKECINVLFLVGLFYFHMLWLVPRFLARRKIVVYTLFVLLSMLVIVTEQQIVEYATFRKIATTTHHPRTQPVHHRPLILRPDVLRDDLGPLPPVPRPDWDKKIAGMPAFIFLITLRKALLSSLLLLLASGFIKIALEWFKAQRKQEELEKEKLHAELGFLKEQVNPHFLFNSLNSIYALAHRKAPETPAAVMQLSQMMRYMIYESNTDTVSLEKELDYLQNYLDLKKLRLTSQVTVDYSIEGPVAGLNIEPMLLIPFVENAFKHGISYTENCSIQIKISVGQHKLQLFVSNKIYRPEKSEPGGLGLTNVTKRLHLLYPEEQHELNTTQENNIYTVSLTLLLKDRI